MIYFNKKPTPIKSLVHQMQKRVFQAWKYSQIQQKIQVNGEGGDTLVIYSHNSNGSPGDFAEE